jgi:hypothetical protein
MAGCTLPVCAEATILLAPPTPFLIKFTYVRVSVQVKGKAIPVTDQEAHRVVRRRGSHIF